MKVLDTKGKESKYGKILGEYLSLLSPGMFLESQNFFFNDQITFDQQAANYEKAKPGILKLKELFKQRTIELNKIAQKQGFPNYVEFYLSNNQITQDKYKFFLDNIDNFVSLVMSDEVPIKKLIEKEKNWNIFNTPYPLGLLIISNRFELPSEILDILSTYDRRVLKYKKRLDIKFDYEDFYPSAYYDKKRNVAEVRVIKQRDDICQALSFVYVLGNALDMIELADKGEDPHKMPKYLSVYRGYEYMHKFIKSQIPEKRQKVLRYNLLSIIASTLFEIDIFTDDQQDFDKAYAKAINRCYPMTRQTENPFYIFYQRFLVRPMGELNIAMAEMELYLKDAKEL